MTDREHDIRITGGLTYLAIENALCFYEVTGGAILEVDPLCFLRLIDMSLSQFASHALQVKLERMEERPVIFFDGLYHDLDSNKEPELRLVLVRIVPTGKDPETAILSKSTGEFICRFTGL